jgi:hypothetical protein
MATYRSWFLALSIAAIASHAHADMFDGMLNRLGSIVERRTENLGERAIDGTFDQADAAVECAVRDKACLDRARREGREVRIVEARPIKKCVASDVACLRDAAAQGYEVQLVNEADLDTMRCSATDTDCLVRAQTLKKRVQIVE